MMKAHVGKLVFAFLYVCVVVLLFLTSFTYPTDGGQFLLVALLVMGAYIGYAKDDLGLFFKFHLACCVVVGFSFLIVGISDVPAFRESLSRAPTWLRILDPMFYLYYWYAFRPDRHGFLVLRLITVFTIEIFLLGLAGVVLGFIISSMAGKKR